MSLEERVCFCEIYLTPEEEWTRREHRFMHEMIERGTKNRARRNCYAQRR